MSGTFSCIGFDFPSSGLLAATAQRLLTVDVGDPGDAPWRLRWTDQTSGARLVGYELADGAVNCCKPSFAVPRSLSVRWRGTVPDPEGCPFCVRAEVDVYHGGVAAYPLLVELEESHQPLRFPRVGARLQLPTAAFAEQLRVWQDARSYAIDQRGGPPVRSVFAVPNLPDSALRPPPSARALITGVVVRAERRINLESGTAFDVITLETQGGALDLLAPATEGRYERGNVIQGEFWLIAQLRA